MNSGMNIGMNIRVTAIRRILVLTGTVLAVMIGTSVSASATFSDAVARTTSITTATVQAPTQVEAQGTCTTTVDPVTGLATTTVDIKIEWWRSPSPGVIGYRVVAHRSNGTSQVMATVGASADQVLSNADQTYLKDQPRFTITTLTSYGWTAQSAASNVLTC